MALPLLETKYSSKPHRVASVPQMAGEDKPWVFDRYDMKDEQESNAFVFAAYRQIFSEHLILECNRQRDLESQLRRGSISVQDFVRGLGKSEVFRRLVLDANNNYRFVEICLKRFLGREPYNQQEKIQLSIIVAQQGYPALIDTLVDSEEYRTAFGSNTLPYQRRPLSQPYNLTTPRLAYVEQADQRRPWEKYTGVKFFIGWQDVVANYVPGGPAKAGDSQSFVEMALALQSKGNFAPANSVWNIKIPDMTSNR